MARTRIAWTLKRERGRDMVEHVYNRLCRRQWGQLWCRRGGGFWLIGVCLRRSGQSRRSCALGFSAPSELLRRCDDHRRAHHIRPSQYTANMHKVSRTSLASLVCPSAPFLAPRLLRTAAPAAVTLAQCPPSARPQRATYATAREGKGSAGKTGPKEGKGLIRKIDPKKGKSKSFPLRSPRLDPEEYEVRPTISFTDCAHNTRQSD